MGFLDMSREGKVNEFRRAGGKKDYCDEPEDYGMVMACIEEELAEFDEAVFEYRTNPGPKTREQLCKEWADLQYVVSQAALYFDIPAEPAFNRVHNSNMTKVVDGKVIYREDGKILKPDTYQAPDMSGL